MFYAIIFNIADIQLCMIYYNKSYLITVNDNNLL